MHDVFAEAVGGADHHGIAEAGLGIDSEHDTGACEVGAHHALHADAERDFEMVEALVHTVADGAVGEERSEAPLACLQQGRRTVDIQVRLLLSGEARVGQIFGGGRGSHRDVQRHSASALQLAIGLADEILQVRRQRGVENDLPHGLAALAQVRHVARVEVQECRSDLLIDSCLADEMAERLGRDRKAIGHFHSLAREFADHLAERRIFSADQRDILDADVGKPSNEEVRVR